MFVQEHHVTMLVYYEHVRQLKQDQEHAVGWDYAAASAKKCYILRFSATVDAFKDAFVGFAIQSTKALNESIIAVLHLDHTSLANAGHYAVGALIDLIALPIIGIIGIFVPAIAFALTAKISDMAKNIISKESEQLYRTTSFNEITARLISPLRGLTDSFSDALQTISQTISKIVNYPITPNVKCMNDIIIPFFKGSSKSTINLLRDECCLADACIKVIAGGMGILFTESRTFLDIYP